MSSLIHLATGSSLAALLAFAAARRGPITKLGCAGTALGAAALLLFIVQRWATSGAPPLSNLYESLLAFSFFALAAGTLFSAIWNMHLLGGAGALFGVLALGYASLLEPGIGPIVPALRSNWMLIHVTACMASYAGFALSFAAAAVYLIQSSLLKKSQEELKGTYQAGLHAVVFAYPLLTIGIVTGAVWANQAWGSYWGWDPKETWSLVTWLIYGVYLHARRLRGWQGRGAAWLLVLAFAAVVFTYFGVSLFLEGLHAYA